MGRSSAHLISLLAAMDTTIQFDEIAARTIVKGTRHTEERIISEQ
jgi:hypothetical protein